MNTRPTEPLRSEHRELHRHVEALRDTARALRHLPPAERETAVRHSVEFLEGTLIPHAQTEERLIYPAWSELVGYPGAAAAMVHDHETIVGLSERLAAAPSEDMELLEELLYSLHALVLAHFEKEEEIVLPAFDADPEAAVHLLAALGDNAAHAHAHA